MEEAPELGVGHMGACLFHRWSMGLSTFTGVLGVSLGF